MYQRVKKSSEVAITLRPEPNSKPPGPSDREVVIDVKEGHLTREKEGIRD
jgi:hypothetical protein